MRCPSFVGLEPRGGLPCRRSVGLNVVQTWPEKSDRLGVPNAPAERLVVPMEQHDREPAVGLASYRPDPVRAGKRGAGDGPEGRARRGQEAGIRRHVTEKAHEL